MKSNARNSVNQKVRDSKQDDNRPSTDLSRRRAELHIEAAQVRPNTDRAPKVDARRETWLKRYHLRATMSRSKI
jgi:hypothetical protein